MFTGIVAGVGRVKSVTPLQNALRLSIAADILFDINRVPNLGASVAVNGICLTVSGREQKELFFDVSSETIACTTIGTWQADDAINLEPALRVGDELGGHWVTGHIDCCTEINAKQTEGENTHLEIQIPDILQPLLVAKGSVAIDGISLTVNRLTKNGFTVMLIPRTLEQTIAKNYEVGNQVNVEGDILGRYANNLLGVRS